MRESLPVYRRPNVLPLSFAAFFNDTGADMLFAFFPLFFVLILGVEELKLLGLIESAALLAGLILRPWTGRFSDARGRTRFIWSGYGLLILSRIGQGLAQVWWHLIPPKLLYEVGRSVRNPPREALLAESVPQDQRGLAFGILKSMDTLGAIVGPLLGLALFTYFLGRGWGLEATYRAIFFAAALPTLASIAITATQLKETRRAPMEVGSTSPSGDSEYGERAAADSQGNRSLMRFTALSCLFSLMAVTENFMVVSGAQVLGVRPDQIASVVILYWLINVTFAPSALVAGRLSDQLGRKPFIVVGLLVLGVLTALFAWAQSFWQIGLLFAAHGVYQGLLSPNQTALVADLAPQARRGETLGRYSMWIGISSIPAPLLFGSLWDTFGRHVPFLASGAIVILSAMLIWLLVHPHPSRRDAGGLAPS